jgi:hypothetical protein
VVPSAQLKVFTPLDAFPPEERARWSAYVRDQRGLTRREVASAEEQHAARRLVLRRGRSRTVDGAAVRRLGRQVLICPLELDLRWAVAFDDFRRTVPPEVLTAFVPDEAWVEAPGVAARVGRPPQVLDAAWAVPLHWFLAFDPSERRLTDPPEGRGPRIVFLTSLEHAQQRVRRAQAVVHDAIEDDEELVDLLGGFLGWLSAFDQGSVLELDYGRLADTFSRVELETDRTCTELWEAVEALEDGDGLAAAAAYGVARARWQGRRATQHAS